MRQTLQSKRRCWRWKPLSWSVPNALLPFDYTSRRGTLVSPNKIVRVQPLPQRLHFHREISLHVDMKLSHLQGEMPPLWWTPIQNCPRCNDVFHKWRQLMASRLKNVVNASHLFKSTLVHCVLSGGWVMLPKPWLFKSWAEVALSFSSPTIPLWLTGLNESISSDSLWALKWAGIAPTQSSPLFQHLCFSQALLFLRVFSTNQPTTCARSSSTI